MVLKNISEKAIGLSLIYTRILFFPYKSVEVPDDSNLIIIIVDFLSLAYIKDIF